MHSDGHEALLQSVCHLHHAEGKDEGADDGPMIIKLRGKIVNGQIRIRGVIKGGAQRRK